MIELRVPAEVQPGRPTKVVRTTNSADNWFVPIEGALPDEFVDSLPEPRRTLHRRAVEVIARHRREGAPYALVLRNYGVVQLFGGTAQRLGDVFENVLVDALEPAGVGVVQVQPPRTEPITATLYAPVARQ